MAADESRQARGDGDSPLGADRRRSASVESGSISRFELTDDFLSTERGSRLHVGLITGVAMVGLWMVWACVFDIPRTIEVPVAVVDFTGPLHLVVTPRAGRIVSSAVKLGDEVAPETVVAVVTAEEDELLERAAFDRVRLLKEELEDLRGEAAASAGQVDIAVETNRSAVLEARTRAGEAKVQLAVSRRTAERLSALSAAGLVANAEHEVAAAQVELDQERAASLDAAAARVAFEGRLRIAEMTAELAGKRATIRRREADLADAQRVVAEVELRGRSSQVRAQVPGRLASLRELRIGERVDEGETIAAIMRDGGLRVVAHVPAQAAGGRLAEGQRARLRSAAVAGTQFAPIECLVRGWDADPRTELVRVVLDVNDARRDLLRAGMRGRLSIHIGQQPAILEILERVGVTREESR